MSEPLRSTLLNSPIGPLTLAASGAGLRHLHFGVAVAEAWIEAPNDPVLTEAAQQLSAYFAGERTGFDLPLDAVGTPFQHAVWDLLREIPYGTTTSYGVLARQLGNPNKARAVGLANGQNPIAIIVPCHRVVGASGSLTGFAGGLATKAFLLRLEQGRSEVPLGVQADLFAS